MASKKKLLQAAAGAASSASLDIPEVFSTYLYDGTGSAQTITNGIDLSGEGGLVWVKNRSTSSDHRLFDTATGAGNSLISNDTFGLQSSSGTSFTSTGFGIGTLADFNNNNDDFVSWTFRKAPKFFDIVTFSGNSTNRTISHNLDADVGFMVVKRTSGSGTNWMCFHRSVGATKGAILNGTNAFSTDSTTWNNTAPTSSVFSLGTDGNVNKTGHDYVAYLFAHNNSDGEFGPDSDQDIIKCGSYTGTGANNNIVNLGFEPQWLMWKNITTTGHDWHIVDTMRGFTAEGIGAKRLEANTTDVEATSGSPYMDISSTGFVAGSSSASANKSGDTYIYMAIRRGPLAEPENATDVFGISDRDAGSGDGPITGFVTDFSLLKNPTSSSGFWYASSRLTGGFFTKTNATDAETSNSSLVWDRMDGVWTSALGSSFTLWGWKRAPSFCDVVAYTGTGSNRTVSHNLGAVPEMMWIKRRDTTGSWAVFHKDLNTTSGEKLNLNSTSAASANTAFFNSTVPTSSVFTVGTSNNTNASSGTYVAYLFATIAGISKVGSVSHTNGTDTNVDCGFSSGARFILLKRTDGASSWYVWDSERGIVAGNDQVLYLQSTLAEQTGDSVDPLSSGFTMVGGSFDTGDYIFYAIA